MNQKIIPVRISGHHQDLVLAAGESYWALTVIGGMEYDFSWGLFDNLRKWMEGEPEEYRFESWTEERGEEKEVAVIVAARFPDWDFLGLSLGGVFSGGPMARTELDTIVRTIEELRTSTSEAGS